MTPADIKTTIEQCVRSVLENNECGCHNVTVILDQVNECVHVDIKAGRLGTFTSEQIQETELFLGRCCGAVMQLLVEHTVYSDGSHQIACPHGHWSHHMPDYIDTLNAAVDDFKRYAAQGEYDS